MSEPTPEIAADVVTACQAGAEEAAGALGRSLDGQFELTVGEGSQYIADGAPQGIRWHPAEMRTPPFPDRLRLIWQILRAP